MNEFIIDHQLLNNQELPEFSITINPSTVTSIYSDAEMQELLTSSFRSVDKVQVFDYEDNLYERLTVADNVRFFWKWFNCSIPLAEILVMFELQHCAKQSIKDCSPSEIRRIYYAKQFMSCTEKQLIFNEPIYGVDAVTVEVFFTMLRRLHKLEVSVCILVTNMEHALLVGDKAYRLLETGLFPIEMEEENNDLIEEGIAQFTVNNLSKIPAKIDDKVILFDPLEIDYIESQEGKAYIIINDDSFVLDSTLAEIEKKLEIYGFFRCHRSYIVNLQKVREIITWSKNTYSLRIDNKVQSTIPLSRTKIQEIQAIFSLK